MIADHEITPEEFNTLKNLINGLGLPESAITEELKVVKEILRMQRLCLPLQPVSDVPVMLQKSETAYYSGNAKVLSRRKAPRNSEAEYEYTVRREGHLVVSDKRVLVVSEGTRQVRLKDILDVDVNLDDSTIVISKDTSSAPTIIQTQEPLYAAKIKDLLVDQAH